MYGSSLDFFYMTLLWHCAQVAKLLLHCVFFTKRLLAEYHAMPEATFAGHSGNFLQWTGLI